MNCPYCRAKAELKDSSVIYRKSYGLVYICSNYPDCDAYVGVHKGTKKPLGRMANAELREAKKKAHARLDPLWKSGGMNRREAYKLLAAGLNIPEHKCHIGMFDLETCERVLEII